MFLAESRLEMKNITACIKGNRINVSANLIQPKFKIHEANIINIINIERIFSFVLVFIEFSFQMIYN